MNIEKIDGNVIDEIIIPLTDRTEEVLKMVYNTIQKTGVAFKASEYDGKFCLISNYIYTLVDEGYLKRVGKGKYIYTEKTKRYFNVVDNNE